MHLLFVDFSKAFDTVPWEPLWYLLQEKYKVPAVIVNTLRRLHTGYTARVTYGGQLDSEAFAVLVGVLQGGITSPVLWNLYLNSVLATWRSRLRRTDGVKVVCHPDGSIRSVQRTNARLGRIIEWLKDLEFADDCVLLAQCCCQLRDTI